LTLVAARSKTWVCARSLVGIVVSNPAGVGLIFRPEDSSECGVYNERDRKAVRGLCAVKKGSRFLQKLI